MEAMAAMTRAGEAIEPAGGAIAKYHDHKYKVFKAMYDNQLAYRAIMQDSTRIEYKTVKRV
jgi:hypothetical protein